jgi:hypothetical protein
MARWITREHPRVDRVACPWLIERFVDKDAEFLYVAGDTVAAEAKRAGATPYDIKDAELGHHGAECSFDAFVHRYALDEDPAIAYMARVIRGADTDDKDLTPESRGAKPSSMACARCTIPTTRNSEGRRGRSSTPFTRIASRR